MIRIRSFLVGTNGLEPSTSCMSSKRSNQLSYAPTIFNFLLANQLSYATSNNSISNLLLLCKRFYNARLIFVTYHSVGYKFLL